MSHIKNVVGFACLAVAIAVLPGVGHAQTCTANTDCAKGTTCQASATSPTPGSAPIACAANTKCDVVIIPDPTPQITMSCQPATCLTDSDCGADMVCHPQTSTTCSGSGSTRPACPANTKCDASVETTTSTCTDTTTLTCFYKWQLPCNTDADCGSDFICSPTVTGSCSGGSATTVARSGTAGSAGPEKPAATPVGPSTDAGTVGGTVETCTSSATFPGYCQAKATVCNADVDCPAHWTCVLPYTNASGGGASSSTGAGGSAVHTGSSDPTTGGTAVVAQTKTCQAPNSFPAQDRSGAGTLATDPSHGGDAGLTTGTPPPTGTENGGSNKATSGAGGGCSVAGGDHVGGGAVLGTALLGLMLAFLAVTARRKPLPTKR